MFSWCSSWKMPLIISLTESRGHQCIPSSFSDFLELTVCFGFSGGSFSALAPHTAEWHGEETESVWRVHSLVQTPVSPPVSSQGSQTQGLEGRPFMAWRPDFLSSNSLRVSSGCGGGEGRGDGNGPGFLMVFLLPIPVPLLTTRFCALVQSHHRLAMCGIGAFSQASYH